MPPGIHAPELASTRAGFANQAVRGFLSTSVIHYGKQHKLWHTSKFGYFGIVILGFIIGSFFFFAFWWLTWRLVISATTENRVQNGRNRSKYGLVINEMLYTRIMDPKIHLGVPSYTLLTLNIYLNPSLKSQKWLLREFSFLLEVLYMLLINWSTEFEIFEVYVLFFPALRRPLWSKHLIYSKSSYWHSDFDR